jgi:hypothetical protein
MKQTKNNIVAIWSKHVNTFIAFADDIKIARRLRRDEVTKRVDEKQMISNGHNVDESINLREVVDMFKEIYFISIEMNKLESASNLWHLIKE